MVKSFITASGQGIGRTITERFIEEKRYFADINYELIEIFNLKKNWM